MLRLLPRTHSTQTESTASQAILLSTHALRTASIPTRWVCSGSRIQTEHRNAVPHAVIARNDAPSPSLSDEVTLCIAEAARRAAAITHYQTTRRHAGRPAGRARPLPFLAQPASLGTSSDSAGRLDRGRLVAGDYLPTGRDCLRILGKEQVLPGKLWEALLGIPGPRPALFRVPVCWRSKGSHRNSRNFTPVMNV